MKNMEGLTFGEQVKIILGRRGMTIKQLAGQIEEKTGKKMSRQNLTQRLGRDNFQEQDMRMIAEILECPFYLSILGGDMASQSKGVDLQEQADQAGEAAPAEEIGALEVSAPVQAGPVYEASAYAEGEPVSEEPAYAEGEPIQEEPEYTEPVNEEAAYAAGEPVQEEPGYTEPVSEEAAYAAGEPVQEEPAYTEPVYEEPAYAELAGMNIFSGERDMTIGEVYDMHQELAALEENARAGEPVESVRKEMEKPKKERFSFFRRRKHQEPAVSPEPEKEKDSSENMEYADPGRSPEPEDEIPGRALEAEAGFVYGMDDISSDFEPVITRNDSDEDTTIGEVNPYTGKEYQSNSVRMHPNRIGYVQVYDRTIHKWTDMTEWAFLGDQERKKALLGKAYEPPIYLD